MTFLWSGISVGWTDLLHGINLQTRILVTSSGVFLHFLQDSVGIFSADTITFFHNLPNLLFANYPTTAQLLYRLASVWTDLCIGFWGCLPEEKRPERKIDHSSSSIAENKSKWNYNSEPHTPSGRGRRQMLPYYLHIVILLMGAVYSRATDCVRNHDYAFMRLALRLDRRNNFHWRAAVFRS